MRPVRRQRLRRPAGYPGIRPASGGPRRAYGAPCALTAAPPPCRCPGIRPASDGLRRAYGAPWAPPAAPPPCRVSWHPASFRRPRRATDGPQRLPCHAGALASGFLQTAQEGLRCALGADSGSAALLCPILTPPPGKFVSADEFEQPTGDPQRLLSFMYNFSDCLKKEFVHKQCTVSDFQPD